MTHPTFNRRQILAGAGALATQSLGGLALQFTAMGQAAAQAAPDDYKALVCLFMLGGNDHANTLVPSDTYTHNIYRQVRGNFAVNLSTPAGVPLTTPLVPAVPLSSGRSYALAPALDQTIRPLWDNKRMAVLLNIGTLLRPTALANYRAQQGVPSKLFSHNDQQSMWQSGSTEGAKEGWGGESAWRRLSSTNADTSTDRKFLFVAFNASRAPAVWPSGAGHSSLPLVGRNTPTGLQLGVPINPVATPFLVGRSGPAATAFRSLITKVGGGNNLEQAYADIVGRSVTAASVLGDTSLVPTLPADLSLQTAQALAANNETLTTSDALKQLAPQVEAVIRMVRAARNSPANFPRRQVFFIGVGGFDTHASLANHQELLRAVGLAMADLDRGFRHPANTGTAAQTGNDVTVFTASDFGRTLTVNTAGSDHGWGSMHFVVGGAVNGGRYFGLEPDMSSVTNAVGGWDAQGNHLGGWDTVGHGRLLPYLAVDQLTATLGRWFGLSQAQLQGFVPNLANYQNDGTAQGPKMRDGRLPTPYIDAWAQAGSAANIAANPASLMV